jgi:hypothetical protein
MTTGALPSTNGVRARPELLWKTTWARHVLAKLISDRWEPCRQGLPLRRPGAPIGVALVGALRAAAPFPDSVGDSRFPLKRTCRAPPAAPVYGVWTKVSQPEVRIGQVLHEFGQWKGSRFGCGPGSGSGSPATFCFPLVPAFGASATRCSIRDSRGPLMAAGMAPPNTTLLRSVTKVCGPHIGAFKVPLKLGGDLWKEVFETHASGRLCTRTGTSGLRASRASGPSCPSCRLRFPDVGARGAAPTHRQATSGSEDVQVEISASHDADGLGEHTRRGVAE